MFTDTEMNKKQENVIGRTAFGHGDGDSCVIVLLWRRFPTGPVQKQGNHL